MVRTLDILLEDYFAHIAHAILIMFMVCAIGVAIFNCSHKPKKPLTQPASKVTFYKGSGGSSNYPSKSKAGVGKRGGAAVGLAAGAGVGLATGLAISNIGSGCDGGASGCDGGASGCDSGASACGSDGCGGGGGGCNSG